MTVARFGRQLAQSAARAVNAGRNAGWAGQSARQLSRGWQPNGAFSSSVLGVHAHPAPAATVLLRQSFGWAHAFSTSAMASSADGAEGTKKKDGDEGEGVKHEFSTDEAKKAFEEFEEMEADDLAKEKEQEVLIEETEQVVGDTSKKHSFQAETRKLLDIVAKSLYSEKEIFIREIVSNASDALEKVRYMQLQNKEVADADTPLEIHISVDEAKGTFTIQDFGVGMSGAELEENLGTIARSGSKAFVAGIGEGGEAAGEGAARTKDSIIGQFGVGFYSTFMVGKEVRVYSRSADPAHADQGHRWHSDGSGTFDLAEASGVQRGTKIVIQLNEESKQFASKDTVKGIIQKYSNFVGFPIRVNGEEVNAVQPLWTRNANEITDDEHQEFYKFVSNAYDKPAFRLHYATDAPIQMRSLFYFPSSHFEKFGMGRLEPGVNLYCRKVLIQAKSDSLLPEWMRFVKGVVDSEDIPINLSRELLQDSRLFGRLRELLTGRILKFLNDQAKREPDAYMKWAKEFKMFITEGLVSDYTHQKDIAKLLRYESSALEAGTVSSLQEYLERAPADQNKIYYLHAPSRALCEASPYYEALKQKGTEVLFMYEGLDDMGMMQLGQFDGKQIENLESSSSVASDAPPASEDTLKELRTWMLEAVGPTQLREVRLSARLVSSPAIIVGHESSVTRHLRRAAGGMDILAGMPQVLEINPDHSLIKALDQARVADPELAKDVALQLFDSAKLTANLLDDPLQMIARFNAISEKALRGSKGDPAKAAPEKVEKVEGEIIDN